MTQTASENFCYNVLIIDRDTEFVRLMLKACARRTIRGTVANNKKSAMDYLDQDIWSMVLVNHSFTDSAGAYNNSQLLKKIKAHNPELPVIMVSDTDSANDAVQNIRIGYTDFLVKPISNQKADEILSSFLPNHHTASIAAATTDNKYLYNLIGQSKPLQQTINIAAKVAPTSAPVLITGQSGTGKELIAQFIHHNSKRASAPFIKVNCAAINDSLLQSELFGHEKGAFTGAYVQHKGRFERAHGGTLLLDEITETKPAFQAQLLRVLEQMDFERVGGSKNISVNVRIISTTNTDIINEVRQKRFREDLYYRLAGIRIALPSLAQRSEDLPLLIWHFVNQFAPELGRTITSIDTVMLEIFKKYTWPGNIRQLKNVVRTSMILGSGNVLSLNDASWLMDELQTAGKTETTESMKLAGTKLEELEHRAIIETLSHTSGNQTKAAKALGISDRTLRDKMKRYRQQGRLQLTG